MSGEIAAIYTVSTGGSAPVATNEAELEQGRGIVGDRYHAGTGTFWKKLQKTRDFEVTLIEAEEIERFNAQTTAPFDRGAFRRNVVTRGIRLNDLVGRRFNVGSTLLEGIRLCEPCSYLAKKLGPEVLERLVHRAGLRARIVEGGPIRVGDSVAPLP